MLGPGIDRRPALAIVCLPSERSKRGVSGRLSPLSGLRNASIVGHGFRGVSREAIVEAYGGEPLDDLRALVETTGIDPADDPFAAAREVLIEVLRREHARG